MVEATMHCGRLLSFNTKTQMIQVWVNEFEEQEHKGLGTDGVQITCVVYPPGCEEYAFFYNTLFSYIFDPLLAVITSHHIVNPHLSLSLPVCPPPCTCVLGLFVCSYECTLRGEGGQFY